MLRWHFLLHLFFSKFIFTFFFALQNRATCLLDREMVANAYILTIIIVCWVMWCSIFLHVIIITHCCTYHSIIILIIFSTPASLLALTTALLPLSFLAFALTIASLSLPIAVLANWLEYLYLCLLWLPQHLIKVLAIVVLTVTYFSLLAMLIQTYQRKFIFHMLHFDACDCHILAIESLSVPAELTIVASSHLAMFPVLAIVLALSSYGHHILIVLI